MDENDKITVELLLGGENFTLLKTDPEGNAGLDLEIISFLSRVKMTLCPFIKGYLMSLFLDADTRL